MIIDWIDHQRLESAIFVWEIEQMKLYPFILVFFSLKNTNFYGRQNCSSFQIFRKSCNIHKELNKTLFILSILPLFLKSWMNTNKNKSEPHFLVMQMQAKIEAS